MESVALTLGAIDEGGPVLVRVHSESLTGDVLGSSRYDCGEQLADSLRFLQEQGRGILLYREKMGHLLPKPVALEVAGGGLGQSPPTAST
jgi:GTP cyclohydrolase II